MTRETKIGLLVGLAFIIVIGILLSDHMSATNEPQQASLGGAGSNVREGVTAPAANAPPVFLGGGPLAVAPRSPVPTRADLDRPKPPVDVHAASGGSVRDRLAAAAERPADEGPRDPAADAGPVTQTPPAPGPRDARRDVRELVLKHPYDLVPADGPGGKPAPGRPGTPPAADPAAPRHYVAQSGDTLSKMAARFLGSAGKANRDLIIRANPQLQAEGNPVVVGRTYVIPNAGPATPATPAPAAPGAPNTVARRSTAPSTPGGATAGTTWYTVKDNDNLWRIAESQLGSGNAWTTIRDLNRDVLKGGETVQVNMRLRIPAKPIASAN